MSDLESRVVELETLVAFQEETVSALNEALVDQRKELDAMERIVRSLAEKMSAVDASPLGADKDDPPPHY